MPACTIDVVVFAVVWLLPIPVAVLVTKRRVRIRAKAGSVRLMGPDLMPTVAFTFVLQMSQMILSALSTKAALFGSVVALVVWFGCRLRVDVTPKRTVVIRTVVYFLPWRWRTSRDSPHAFTNGLGDLMDASVLNLGFGNGAEEITLGWEVNRRTPSCEDFAAKINEAIARLSPAPPAGSPVDTLRVDHGT